MSLQDLHRAIELALKAADPYEALEQLLDREFGDDAERKLAVLEERVKNARVPPHLFGTLGTMAATLRQELGHTSRFRKPEEPPQPEEPVATAKTKRPARSAFKAAKEEATAKKPAPKKKGSTKKPAKQKPAPKKQQPVRPIYDELVPHQVVMMPVEDLVAWPGLNPRRVFDPAEMDALVESVRESGVRQPLGVKLNAKAPHYVAFGERRLRAAVAAKVQQVPVRVMDVTEAAAFKEALLENIGRADLGPIEEARAIKKLQELDPTAKQGAIGAMFGHDQPWVSNRLRLLQLPEDALELAERGVVSGTALRDSFLPFARLTDEKLRAKVLKAFAKKVGERAADRRDLPLGDDTVRGIVAQAAREMSKSLVKRAGEWRTEGAVFVTLAAHADCGCGAPKFEFSYQAETRCFNRAWWNERQALGKKEAEASKERLVEEEEDKPVDRTAFQWDQAKVIPDDSWGVDGLDDAAELMHPARGPGGGWVMYTLIDPAHLDMSRVFMDEHFAGSDGRPGLIYMGDDESLERAQKAAATALELGIAQERRERIAAEMEELGASPSRVLVADLALVLSSLGYGANGVSDSVIRTVAEDLLVEDVALANESTLAIMLAILAHRIRKGTVHKSKTSHADRRAELQAKYTAALLEALPFQIPTATDEDSDGEGDEAAEREEVGAGV